MQEATTHPVQQPEDLRVGRVLLRQPRRSVGLAYVLQSLRRSPTGMVGVLVVLMMLGTAVFADQLAPHDPAQSNLRARFQGPGWTEEGNWDYPLGTDQLGRDMLSRIIKGSQVSVVVGVASVALAGTIGVLLGLLAGYFRGIWDSIIMRITDAFLSIPFIVLVVAISGVVGPGLVTLIIILGFTGWESYTRVIRGEVLSVQQREYVLGARVIGQRPLEIALRHVLPNVMGSVIVLATLQVATSILAESSLSFLGLGIQPPVITWGNMLADGRQYVGSAWWMATFPGIAITLAVLGIVFVGDWLSDLLNPSCGDANEMLMGQNVVMQPEWVVPRSRIGAMRREMRAAIYEALAPVLFGDSVAGARVRAEFEQRFAAALGRRYCIATHSGTAGLFLALRACDVGPGDEVITVANSDISTTAAISHCGATPVFCDVRPTDYTIDPTLVEALITERTRAILPVDLYGHPADVRALRQLAQQHNLAIVEDACLAVGARDYDAPVGAFADALVVSFAPYKPLGSAGNGGAVLTDDPAIAEQLYRLCGYGRPSVLPPTPAGYQFYAAEGYNLPLDPCQCAILLQELPLLAEWTVGRRRVADRYAAGLVDSGVRLPCFRPAAEPTFRCYTVGVAQRDQIFVLLQQRGIEVVLHYTPPLHHHPIYADRVLPGSQHLPVTETLAERLLCLPVAPELTDAEVDYVIVELRRACDECA